MVTHDSSLAQRVSRTVIIADGEVVNEYVARAMPSLTPQQMLQASRKAQVRIYQAGATVIQEGQPGENFYIITKGCAEVLLKRPGGSGGSESRVVASRMEAGQSFGEISLFNHRRTVASVRAIPEAPLEVLALDSQTFYNLVEESNDFSKAMRAVIDSRIAHNQAVVSAT